MKWFVVVLALGFIGISSHAAEAKKEEGKHNAAPAIEKKEVAKPETDLNKRLASIVNACSTPDETKVEVAPFPKEVK